MRQTDVRSSTRIAGLINRYHEWPTSRIQTNAEHSWNVARIYLELWGRPRVEVLEYVIYHDVGELGVGDVPFPVKARNPDLKEIMDRLERESLAAKGVVLPTLTDEERLQVKICDLLEMWEFGVEEMTRGNQFGKPIVDDTWRAIAGMLAGSPERMAMVETYVRRYQSWLTPTIA